MALDPDDQDPACFERTMDLDPDDQDPARFEFYARPNGQLYINWSVGYGPAQVPMEGEIGGAPCNSLEEALAIIRVQIEKKLDTAHRPDIWYHLGTSDENLCRVRLHFPRGRF